MGVAGDLRYRIPAPSRRHRLAQSLGSTRPGAWLFAKSLRRVDDVVARLSGGRTSAPELLAGLPTLDVTTRGRRSGLPRTSHLIAVPYDGTLALLGTNFGQRSTPSWALNLEADPRCSVTHHGTTLELTARPATEDERAAVLAGSTSVYGGYLKYQERIAHRRLRIFVLE